MGNARKTAIRLHYSLVRIAFWLRFRAIVGCVMNERINWMKNIVAITGSNHKDSRTHRLLHMWLKQMAEVDDTINYELFCLRDFKINMCEGCDSCFRGGICILDRKDDMPFLREKMFKSDIIIFSSPVYMHNMSGIMKNFVDRMAFCSHILALSGKFGFTVTTTVGSGEKTVSQMLQQFQTLVGIKNINNFVFVAAYETEMTAINEWVKISIEDLSSQLGFSDQRLEMRFSALKRYYSMGEVENSGFWSEIKFWQQPAVQQCSSFQEFAVKYQHFQKPSIAGEKVLLDDTVV